jgi:hypothetical protein
MRFPQWKNTWLIGCWLAAVLLGSTCACNLQPKRSDPESASRLPFRPPTIVPTEPLPTETLAPEARLTATVECTDLLVYVSDVTIPDGTVVEPGSTLDKRWEVENTGSCNWDANYHLKLVSGDAMGVEEQQALYPARAGTRPVIRIQFTAPAKAGQYRSAWQAYNPKGEPFGDPFYIQIIVKAK